MKMVAGDDTYELYTLDIGEDGTEDAGKDTSATLQGRGLTGAGPLRPEAARPLLAEAPPAVKWEPRCGPLRWPLAVPC